MPDPNTPVIIGVGQSSDRLDAADYHAWSATQLAEQAARAALADAGAGAALASLIDTIATTRTFEDSLPAAAPFGKSACLPRSLARRLGIAPAYALWVKGGGNSPQDLVTEACARIASGQSSLALLAGAEAISTIRHAQRTGGHLDFGDHPGGQVEDRGPGYADYVDALLERHGADIPALAYGLAETARRARLGLSRSAYARQMAELFAPFAAVAHRNRRAAWDTPAWSPEELLAVGEKNRWIASPYPLRLVARDQVNLGAAILIASVATARSLGVPDSKLVFLHGHAQATEKPLLQRPDLGASPAARAVVRSAMQMAGVDANHIASFDFYSCFPIAVSNVAVDELGLLPDDPRRLTVTGGLPYFGGPGNNYAMHAIAEMVEVMRANRGSYGLIGANGGFLTKYSAGVYSTEPCQWRASTAAALQDTLDAVSGVAVHEAFAGAAIIESYSVYHERGVAAYCVIVARDRDGTRCIARSDDVHAAARMMEHDALGWTVRVESSGGVNRFRID
ncbi:MAG: acetyl-CoA acetyltransferase [Pseudomonadota bacterium]